jgi:hypothetical protein
LAEYVSAGVQDYELLVARAPYRHALCISLYVFNLEAANPGYGIEIACVLVEKASEDIIRKVDKSLRSKRKKIVFSWKFSRHLD